MLDFESDEKALGLPAGILAAIAAQESGGDVWAFRYEPAFFARYIEGRPRAVLGGTWPSRVTEESERRARAISWGPLQIMGQVARELGFDGPFLSALCGDAGIEYGAKRFKQCLDRHRILETALSAYNAGTPTFENRQSYVLPILKRFYNNAATVPQ